MSNDTVLDSNPFPSDHSGDEEDLKTLKLQELDLDHFAAYFDLAFQGNSQSVTVLVALLKRLCGVERLRQQNQSGIWIEDVVNRFVHRLYTRCDPGFEAASHFGNEASELAESIFAAGLAASNK